MLHSHRLAILFVGLVMLFAICNTAHAVDPYDGAFGVQWNRILDGAGTAADGGGQVVVANDGTVWTGGRSNDQTFGPFNGGTSVQAGIGNWSDTGNLLFGRMPTIDAVKKDPSDPTEGWPSQHYGGSIAVDGSGNTYQTGLTRYNFPGAPMQGGSEPYLQKRDPDGNLLWTTSYGAYRFVADDPATTTVDESATWDNAQAVAVDAAGNTWSAGYAPAPLINASSYTAGGGYDPYIAKINADGSLANVGIQPSGLGNDRAYGIAVDQNNGNVAIVGWGIYSAVNDPAIYGAYLGGARDGILGIYDSDMNKLGGIMIGADYRDAVYDVKFDSDGNVVVAGYVNGTETTSEYQAYVAKYDTAGGLLWSDTFGSAGAAKDEAYAVDIDAGGNIYVAGQTTGDLAGTNAGMYDLFLRKYDKTGANTYAEAWTSQWGTAEDDKLPLHGFALDDEGTGYVNGNTKAVWPDETHGGGQAYLMLKVSVGDFDSDGDVDWTDLITVIDAVDGGPTGNDTYDFDGNGDSDADDVTYFMEEIFDSQFGDFDYDGTIDQDDYDLLDSVLGDTWQPGDAEVPMTHDELIALGWRGFTGPVSANNIGFEEWDLLYDATAAVPEPSTLLLMALGCLGGLAFRRRRMKNLGR